MSPILVSSVQPLFRRRRPGRVTFQPRFHIIVIKLLRPQHAAIRLAPTDSLTYNSRAWTYQLAGRDKEALADSDKALELEPNNALAYDTRGTIHHDVPSVTS